MPLDEAHRHAEEPRGIQAFGFPPESRTILEGIRKDLQGALSLLRGAPGLPGPPRGAMIRPDQGR